MSEYIITDEQLETLGGISDRIGDIDFILALGRIGRDMPEIVRCRECKFLIPENQECDCEQWRGYAGLRCTVEPDGFCAWGVRE